MIKIQQRVPSFSSANTVLPAVSETESPAIGSINVNDYISAEGSEINSEWLILLFYPLDFAFNRPVKE